ncbi:MAG: M36 family metallopeptidase, partial [Nocardioides sp.]
MTHSPRARSRARAIQVGTAAAAVLALAVASGQSYAAGSGSAPVRGEAGHKAGSASPSGFYDSSRGQGSGARARELRTASKANDRAATTQFRASLPGDAILDIDGSTGSVRMLTRLDGFLTGRSKARAQSVARRYVAAHRAALGIPDVSMKQFRLTRNYRDITGTHHLYFHERISGHTVYGNGLTASVNRRGRLLTVGGSPVNARTADTAAPSRIPTAQAAIIAARTRLGDSNRAVDSRDRATRVLFVTPTGAHPGWWTVITSTAHPTSSVLDAATGRVLQRRPLSSDASSEGTAYQYFPRARRGGKQIRVNYTKKGWLGPHAHRLSGNNSHAYSDVNDNDRASRSEEVRPRRAHRWNYRLKPFHPASASEFCGKPYPCSWNPNKPYSWRVNRKQNAAQVFYYVNNWHDHLQKGPIGFTEAAGNFQRVNASKHGKDRDAVETQTDDGANTDHGLPDGNHIDNANMGTPPDGMRPTMQMYLQHQPGTSYPDEDPF